MKRKSEPELRFETFRRLLAGGRRVIYVRFLGAGGRILVTRSTGAEDEKTASAEIVRLARGLDIEALEAAAEAKGKPGPADLRLSESTFPAFLAWFWGPESDYLKDKAAARQPLSSSYLGDCRRYIRLYIAPWSGFAGIPLRSLSFGTLDRFFRGAREFPKSARGGKVSPGMIAHMRNLIGKALSWGAARGLCPAIDLKGLVLPTADARERGLLSDDEVARILALPTQELWRETTSGKPRADTKPRPRLPGGVKHPPILAIDIRMKAFVLMGPFLGFRRGEERGVRWKSVLLEEGLIRVENNYVVGDGNKAPKAGSYGTLPIGPELEVVLWELHEIARVIGYAQPEDYILFNIRDRSRPTPEATLRRGWERIMRAIGISDAERKRRNLVPHGTRHRFATKLIDAGMDPREAQKLTRHKTLKMLALYSDHVSEETMAKAVEAVKGRDIYSKKKNK